SAPTGLLADEGIEAISQAKRVKDESDVLQRRGGDDRLLLAGPACPLDQLAGARKRGDVAAHQSSESFLLAACQLLDFALRQVAEDGAQDIVVAPPEEPLGVLLLRQ